MKKLNQNLKVNFLEVLYHFTAKFHIKAAALMHSNKGFLLLTKPKIPSKSFQTPLKKTMSLSATLICIGRMWIKKFLNVNIIFFEKVDEPEGGGVGQCG